MLVIKLKLSPVLVQIIMPSWEAKFHIKVPEASWTNLIFFVMLMLMLFSKSNQGNQGYSSNQKNVIQGQRPEMENRHTQQRT